MFTPNFRSEKISTHHSRRNERQVHKPKKQTSSLYEGHRISFQSTSNDSISKITLLITLILLSECLNERTQAPPQIIEWEGVYKDGDYLFSNNIQLSSSNNGASFTSGTPSILPDLD